MQIIIDDVDITPRITSAGVVYSDNAGGSADTIDLIFDDTERLWEKWRPKRGQVIQFIDEKLNTGKMYLDQREQSSGMFVVGARSTPQNKTNVFKSWEHIRFKLLAKNLAESVGLQVEFYDIEDYLYESVIQSDETSLECLNRLCIREGYSLKVYDGKAIIYDVKSRENSKPVLKIQRDEVLGEPEYFEDAETKSLCIVRHATSNGAYHRAEAYADVPGGILKIDEVVSSQAEAYRYAVNHLNNWNCDSKKGYIAVELNKSLTSGQMIELENFGLADGVHFIKSVVHDYQDGASYISFRRKRGE